MSEITKTTDVRKSRMPHLPRLRFLVPLAIFITIVLVTVTAPLLAPHDPTQLAPVERLKLPSADYWLGTDSLGRDILSRLLYGGRISLVVGIGAAAISISCGLLFGIMAGFFRPLDTVLMRIMDGIMAIPAVLVALAIVAFSGAGLGSVLVAISIPEIPRVVRLVRAIVLSAREEPYVEAAIGVGTGTVQLIMRHIMPSTYGPLIVQATYVCAAAMLIEAILSFLGVGIDSEVPSWGNMIAEGRSYFYVKPSLIFWPGLLLSLTVLSINMIGDMLRDRLDPKLKTLRAQA